MKKSDLYDLATAIMTQTITPKLLRPTICLCEIAAPAHFFDFEVVISSCGIIEYGNNLSLTNIVKDFNYIEV